MPRTSERLRPSRGKPLPVLPVRGWLLSRAGTTRLAIHHRLRDRRGRTTRGAKPSFWSRMAASPSLRRSRTSVGVLPIPSESTMTSAAGGSETMVTGCVDGLTKVAQPVEIASTATSSPRFDDIGFIRLSLCTSTKEDSIWLWPLSKYKASVQGCERACYSDRSATIGSTRRARRSGVAVDRIPTSAAARTPHASSGVALRAACMAAASRSQPAASSWKRRRPAWVRR